MMDLIEQQIDVMTPEHLETLLAAQQGPCVSMYIPTHRVWNETPQDSIRLKNLLREAEKKLDDWGLRSTEVSDLLAPARTLEDSDSFWRTQRDGLALFLSPETGLFYRLPLNVKELVVVNDRFHVKPLLKLLAGKERFYVLSLSMGNVQLLAGTPYSLSPLDLEHVPDSLAEALKYDVFETQQQFHSGAARTAQGGERAAMFHGQGAAADDANVKKRVVEFFRKVDNGVCDALAEAQAPLVLVGLDHLRGLYRDVNHYTYLTEGGIAVNPEGLTLDELHQRAWSFIEPHFQQSHEEAVTAYEQLVRTEPERVSNQLEDVVPAAFYQRVKVLFVRSDTQAWGTFDQASQEVERHQDAGAQNQDLLDFAAAHTLRYAGTVYLEDAGTMPDNTEAAAIFRY